MEERSSYGPQAATWPGHDQSWPPGTSEPQERPPLDGGGGTVGQTFSHSWSPSAQAKMLRGTELPPESSDPPPGGKSTCEHHEEPGSASHQQLIMARTQCQVSQAHTQPSQYLQPGADTTTTQKDPASETSCSKCKSHHGEIQKFLQT